MFPHTYNLSQEELESLCLPRQEKSDATLLRIQGRKLHNLVTASQILLDALKEYAVEDNPERAKEAIKRYNGWTAPGR